MRSHFRDDTTSHSIGRLLRISLWLAVLSLALPVSGPWAAPGDLDPSFGLGGKVITDFGPGSNQANALVIQPDGKIVAAGSSGSGHFAIARYNSDGSLDPGFGVSGQVVSDLGGFSEDAYGLAIQQDGKLVAVGTSAPQGYCCQAVIARSNEDGSLDRSFGDNGRVNIDFSGGLQDFSAVAIQTDGKIVAVGSGYSPFYSVFTIARFLPDGALDPSFDGDGKATTDFGGISAARAVAMQGDGKIVSVGIGGPSGGFAIARDLPDGSLDPAFGQNGRILTEGSGSAVAIQADGKIVAGGQVSGRFGLVRLNPDGSLDTGFGDNGRATVQFTGDNLEDVGGLAIQTDGRIVVAGRAFVAYDGQFALARIDGEGRLDPGFGSGGKVLTDFGVGDDGARAIALDADGRIVVAGGAGACTPLCGFALARYENAPSSVEVPVAIKPDAGQGKLSLTSHGVVPIAILATDTFDATEVDAQTVCFGSAGDPTQRDCTVAHEKGRLEDVNGDGRTDLVLRFDVQETGIQSTDAQACLTGRTFAGLQFHGCATLRLRPGVAPSDVAGAGPVESGSSTWGSVAGPTVELLSVGPNPAPGSACSVRLRLDGQGEASLQVLDISGRLVADRDLSSLGAGIHEVSLSWTRAVATSMYWLRLTQGGRSVSKKVVLLH